MIVLCNICIKNILPFHLKLSICLKQTLWIKRINLLHNQLPFTINLNLEDYFVLIKKRITNRKMKMCIICCFGSIFVTICFNFDNLDKIWHLLEMILILITFFVCNSYLQGGIITGNLKTRLPRNLCPHTKYLVEIPLLSQYMWSLYIKWMNLSRQPI